MVTLNDMKSVSLMVDAVDFFLPLSVEIMLHPMFLMIQFASLTVQTVDNEHNNCIIKRIDIYAYFW